MRWITATALLAFLASAGEPVGGQPQGPRDRGQSAPAADDLVADMARRLEALERSHAELLARVQRLEQRRDRELRALRTLLDEPGPPSLAPPSNSPLAPQAPPKELSEGMPETSTVALEGEEPVEGTPAAEATPAAEPVSPAHQLIQQAEQLIDEQKYQTAIRILGLAIELDPALDEAYFYRGVASHLQGRYAEALEDFDKAIAVTERANVVYTCLYNKACGQALLGEKDAAIALLEQQEGMVGQYWSLYTDQQAALEGGTALAGTTWQVIVNLATANGAKIGAVKPVEGATGWSDTWMISSNAEHPNCMYMWMNHIISPEANAAVAEWFGEAPANQKSCALTADADHCATFHAEDDGYWDDVWYWTTATEECLDGRTDVQCVPYADWVTAWAELRA